MADFNQLNTHSSRPEYDAIEQALAARPRLSAPRHTSARVMARLAAMSQAETALIKATRYPAPVIKYVSPAALPLPDAPEALELTPQRQRRQAWGFMIMGMWLGGCLLALWAIWPAISNLVFGPSSDPATQAHLETLQSLWNGYIGFWAEVWLAYGIWLPSILSGLVGLAVMLVLVLGPTRRRPLSFQ